MNANEISEQANQPDAQEDLSNKRVKRSLKTMQAFNVATYTTLAIRLLLFLTVGIQFMGNRGGGAGDVLALFYAGPMLIADIVILTLFCLVIAFYLMAKSYDEAHEILKIRLSKSGWLFLGYISAMIIPYIFFFV